MPDMSSLACLNKKKRSDHFEKLRWFIPIVKTYIINTPFVNEIYYGSGIQWGASCWADNYL